MNNRLCISSTYFEYPVENRYTWYSPDKKTKKKNDYVLVEPYVQQYISGCIADPDVDFDSDHRILITTLETPMSRKARRTPNRKKKKTKGLDIKGLNDEIIKNCFKDDIITQLQNTAHRIQQESSEISDNVVKTLRIAAENNFPNIKPLNSCKEIWKEDPELDQLLSERNTLSRQSDRYRVLTKAVKRRITHLRNLKIKQEADEINENWNRRQIEELYRNMKNANTSFRKLPERDQCNPTKLTKYFKSHFNTTLDGH